MKLDEFIKLFAEQFEDTDPKAITASCSYRELEEWSSLISLSIIALARTQYGKSITGKEMKECNTVQDLYNLLESK